MERRSSKILAALVLSIVGCEDNGATPPAPDTFTDAGATTSIQGYVWDPEVFWFALATCVPPGQTCPAPPIVLPNTPLFAQAAVPNAIVGLFDPTQPMQTMPLPFMASAPTAFDGGWSILNVPQRPGPPYFPIVGAVLPSTVDAGAPTVPPAKYLPTFTIKPIATGKTTQCVSQAAGVVGDSGALEAVAKAMTLGGLATTVADLVNPMKTGGVLVAWLWIPGPSVLKVPAFGATVKSDIGTAFQISWAPPGAAPPFVQSARGFFVNNMPPSPTGPPTPGLTVIVLPPAMGPTTVQLTAVDPVTDAASKRPYAFPPLPPIQVAPGLVTFGELQGLTAGGTIPDFVCLP